MTSFIANQNIVDDAAVTTDSEVSTLPAENVKNSQITKIWRTSSGTAYLQIDYGSSVAAEVLFLFGVTFVNTTTLRLRASDADFTTGDLLDTSAGFSINETYKQVVKKFNRVTARYWRIDITAAAAFDVGRVFISDIFQPELNVNYPISYSYKDNSEIRRMEGGQFNTYVRPKQKNAQVSFGNLREAEAYGQVFAALDRITGTSKDIVWVENINGTYLHEKLIYGRLLGLGEVSHPNYGIYRKDYQIEEGL